jgi:hypothetical protein
VKDIVAITGLVLLTVGCGIERLSLALIVSGVILLTAGIGGHFLGRPRRRNKR